MRKLLALLAIGGLLYLSRLEYEMEADELAAEREMVAQSERAAVADSLGLTGQDWLDYVNGYEE